MSWMMAEKESQEHDKQAAESSVDDAQNPSAREARSREAEVPSSDVENAVADAVALQQELGDAKERALRLQAELENLRKRSQRELDDVYRYAALPLMRDLLTVLDNVDRAVEAGEKSEDRASLLDGVKLVRQQLERVLAQHHLAPIESEGQPFDPHRHEAILQQPSTEHEPGTVMQVTQQGYQLHDRVVRPSQVIVSAEPEQS